MSTRTALGPSRSNKLRAWFFVCLTRSFSPKGRGRPDGCTRLRPLAYISCLTGPFQRENNLPKPLRRVRPRRLLGYGSSYAWKNWVLSVAHEFFSLKEKLFAFRTFITLSEAVSCLGGSAFVRGKMIKSRCSGILPSAIMHAHPSLLHTRPWCLPSTAATRHG